MKKKGIAAMLAAIMLASSFSVPTFARYTPDNSDYVYRDTTNLEVEVDPATDQIVLTWPAVNKEGELLNQNPLRADGQVESNGNPTAGWTNPTNGMIIAYDGWLPDGTHNSIANDNKVDHDVIMGIVDYETDYPIFVKDPRLDTTTSAQAVKAAYIDTTVVSKSLATAYQVQYSEDGVNWTEDHIASTFNHGKKLTRDNGTQLVDDKKNTFFLESQITEAMTSTNLKPDTTYYIRVNAFDASTPTTKATPYKTFEAQVTTPALKILTPAFPTVEGGGTYSQGGRGGDVYVVTNLTDSVSNPQPGSLRYGLERLDTGNKTAPRTIVFAVGGTIHIDEKAAKSERRMNVNSNTTILGQTAPGEGITIAGSSMKFDGEDIIVRYMRFRLGGGYDLDAATATGKHIVIDHCTFSWGVDEVFSAKEIVNSSIQYNIISSGLAMPNKNGVMNNDAEVASGESEAKHGMGSILNGYDTSYTHNLWAHNGTRNPRFEGGFTYNGVAYNNKIDYANNVVYNWGHNASYGGERGSGQMNFVGNYYKPGPETLEKVKYLMDCDAEGSNKSSYYVNGNKLAYNDEITADNTKGFNEINNATILTTPVELTIPYTATSAEDAYNAVIEGVGASYKRDPQDNRLILEVDSGSGSFINDQSEAGGFEDITFTSNLTDTDNDGLPDEYEKANNLNPADFSDSAAIITDESSPYNGYSNIEVYACDLLGEWGDTPTKEFLLPHATILGILDETGTDVMKNNGTTNTTLIAGKTYTVNCPEMAVSHTDVYLNNQKVAENSLTFTPDTVGVYNLSCLSKDTLGYRQYTPAKPITVVNGENNLSGFTSIDIGEVGAAGADNYDSATGTLISQGAGRIGKTNTSGQSNPDAFHYNYKTVTGDFTFSAKIDNLSKIDYRQKSGLMVRESIDDTKCRFYMAGLTYLKGEDLQKDGQTDVIGGVKAKNIMSFIRNAANRLPVTEGKFLGVTNVREGDTPVDGYARIERVGDTITISASNDNETWYELNSYKTTLPETVYVGFATEAAQDTSAKVRYNATAFSNIELRESTSAALLGDVNCDGDVTAEDCALILQYVLNSTTHVTPQGLKNADITGTGEYIADTAAQILQKVLSNSYLFPVERQ